MWWFGASIAACRSSPKWTWPSRACSVHWSCWSPPGVPNARYGSPVACDERRRERRPRTLARLERVRQALLRARTSERECRGRSRARASPASPRASRRSAWPRPCSRSGRRRPGGRCPLSSRSRRLADPGRLAMLGVDVDGRQARLDAAGEPGARSAAASSPTSLRRSSRTRGRAARRSARRRIGVPVPRLAVGEGELRALGQTCTYARVDWPSSRRSKPSSRRELLQEDGRLAPRPRLQHSQPVVVDRERRLERGRQSARSSLREQPAVPLAGAVEPGARREAGRSPRRRSPRYQTSCAASICPSRSVAPASASVDHPPVGGRERRVPRQRSGLGHRQVDVG